MPKLSLAAATLAIALLCGASPASAQFMPGGARAAQGTQLMSSDPGPAIPSLGGRSLPETPQLIPPAIRSAPAAAPRPDFLNVPYEGTTRVPPAPLAQRTEFQEEFDMPWLYGVAGLTGLGRVAERKHWVSDTVGGAIMGYAVGRALWRRDRDPKRSGPEITIAGRGVQARWTFD